MISPTVVLIISSFLVIISEAGNTTVTSKNRTNACAPAAFDNEPVCTPYGQDSHIFNNGGYCKHIIGNLPVDGMNKDELSDNEKKMRRFQMAKDFVLQSRKNGQWEIIDGFEVRQSCLDAVDDIYCHHYFKRCYINSSAQPLCREACEELYLKLCDREYKMVLDFNSKQQGTLFPYYWDIINCTALPFRDKSRNCYYPDKIREKLNVLESEDCFYGDGRGYRGKTSTTVSGYTCQSWNEQCPHKHNISGAIYKEIRNSSNFCRNPGGFGLNGTWCYTTNRTVQWEYCDVPKCAKQPPSSPPAKFGGHNLSSTNIQVFWGDVPKPSVHGILFGFHVICERLNTSDRHFADMGPEKRKWAFKGLEIFTNYSCRVRAYNNFGNGTWSEELVISTDEDVPSAPPKSLKAWNLSSTSLHVKWGPIPVMERHGKILGYEVEIGPEQQKQAGIRIKQIANYTTSRSLTFNGLMKYSKYVISVSALTRRGRGPSRVLTVQTDEDVPDHPPREISAVSLGTDAVQLNWRPVAPDYTNGEVLGYRVFYNNVNDKSRVNSTVVSSPEGTRLKIGELKPSTNYSFQILAFTAKGNGAISTNYFAKTVSDPVPGKNEKPSSSVTAIIVAAVFSGIVAIGAVLLAIYFVRKKRSPNSNEGNSSGCGVAPYATSSLDWIERIIANHCHGYDTLDDENVLTTSRQPLYVNLAADGSLNLPPYLRDIVLEFEQSYENTKYKRLHRRRRSLGGAVDIHGQPIYDQLQRVISPCTASDQSNSCSQEAQGMTTTESPKEHKQHHSVDLGELRGFVQSLQGGAHSTEITEMRAVEQATHHHRRRFSVDLGEVRGFIALREMKVSSKDESTALPDQPEVHATGANEATC